LTQTALETGCGFTHATVSGAEIAVPLGLGFQPTQGRLLQRRFRSWAEDWLPPAHQRLLSLLSDRVTGSTVPHSPTCGLQAGFGSLEQHGY